MTITLDSLADFTLDAARRVAWQGEGVALGPRSQAAIADARARFERLLEDPEVSIYGVTSGYGQNAKIRLSLEERKTHANRPPSPAAASWGEPLPDRVTRAILFARLANIVEGHGGISLDLAQSVAEMLDGRPLPRIPTRGQGGAGEILSLSHLFIDLAAGREMAEKESVTLINGSPAATGLAVDAALAATRRIEIAAEVLALAAEGFNAPLEHFAEELESHWNNPYDAWALERVWGLIDGGHGGARRPYQAPVSFRIIPRILGQARLAADTALNCAEESLGAVSDNPALLAPDEGHPNGRAISTGGFHNAQVPMVLDMVTAAYANICCLAGRLAAKTMDAPVSLLPAQLGAGEGKPYLGCLPMAITGYEEEVRSLATATLIPGSESGGFGQNDVASPVFLAWSKQERAGELLEQSLAALTPIAVAALDLTERPCPAPLEKLAEASQTHVPVDQPGLLLGPATAGLAGSLRRRIYEA